MPKKKNLGILAGGVKPVETEELAKSIAKDLNIPDRPLSIQELAATDPFTGKPRKQEQDDVYFDLSPPSPEELEKIAQNERREEEALIDQIDQEFDE